MTQYMQDPALWALIAGTPLAAAAIYRGRKLNTRLREENSGLRDYYAALESGHSAAVAEAQSNAEEATKTALKTAMRTLQGLANEQQLVISRLQKKYGDSQILQDLLEIDHTNTQFGRRAQSIAVLCDGWLGRQRAVASVYDVARSAKGRIKHYTRVEIRSQSNFAVVSRAVEPVALALAELLDNATSYSAPETQIEINIRSVPKGVCIIVDDAGVGMNEEEKTRAARLLSPQRATGVTGLGNPPQFGFAVIGVLAARYGFSVSVDTESPYGGVRAVLLLPEELLTTSIPEPEKTPAASMETPQTPPQAAQTPEVTATTSGGLPKRRRKGAMAIVPPSDAPGSPARSSEETASIMGAFQRGTQSGRAAHTNREGQEFQ
ncbi:ATP-binding protein [Streptomyces sp. NPDC054796]|uniref:histidine kinase n=1 Tax=Streptomyces daliensis TaxID=299421 RepID=A0A8T4IZT4_9ACTN|nr:sensor histidine kinase [Streptomyces daliensis]